MTGLTQSGPRAAAREPMVRSTTVRGEEVARPAARRGAALHRPRASYAGDAEPGRLALLAGEPGSGKSRLVRELAASAAGREQALVLYGACDAAVRTPYGPFAEALEPLTRPRLLPDLAAAGRAPEGREADDPDTERYRLHTAVAALLAEASRERPLLLVLEDVHWADTPSLLLLGHLARSAAEARLLLVATFRDTETEVPRPLAETLADLRRSEHVVRLRLEGLSAAEVGELARYAAGCEPGPELARLGASMRELTGGNVFLVGELWRALAETGAVDVRGGSLRVIRPPEELASPESVREVAGQRLARLAPATTELLELAAVAGAGFELDLLRRAAGLGEAELLAALDEAVASGMIEELPAPGSPAASRTSWCGGRSTTGSRGDGARSCTCGSARRWRSPARNRGATSPTSPITSPRRRRWAMRGERSSTTCAPPAPPPRRSPSRRRRRRCAPRSGCASTIPLSAPSASSSWAPSATGRAMRRRR